MGNIHRVHATDCLFQQGEGAKTVEPSGECMQPNKTELACLFVRDLKFSIGRINSPVLYFCRKLGSIEKVASASKISAKV